MNKPLLDDLAHKIFAALPPGLKILKSDTVDIIKTTLNTGFSKMDLVTRKEFDLQVNVLHQAKQRIKDLEQQLKALCEPKCSKKNS